MSLKLFIFLRWKFINQTIKIIRIKRLVVFKTLHVSLMKWSNLVKVKQQPTFWNDSGMHLSRNLLQCSSFSVRSLVGKKNILKYQGNTEQMRQLKLESTEARLLHQIELKYANKLKQCQSDEYLWKVFRLDTFVKKNIKNCIQVLFLFKCSFFHTILIIRFTSNMGHL